MSDKFQHNKSDSVTMDNSDEEYSSKKDHVTTLQCAEIDKQIQLLKTLQEALRDRDIIISDLKKQKDQYLSLHNDLKLRNMQKDNYIKLLENSYSLRIARGIEKLIPQSICSGIKKIFDRRDNQV